MDISALKAAVDHEVNKSRLWQDAQLILNQIAGLFGNKAELENAIAKLKEEHIGLGNTSENLKQMNLDADRAIQNHRAQADDYAAKCVVDAKATAAKLVSEAKETVNNILASVENHKLEAAKALKAAQEAQDELKKHQDALQGIKDQKAKLVKSLTE